MQGYLVLRFFPVYPKRRELELAPTGDPLKPNI